MTNQRTITVLRKLIVDTVNADPHATWGCLDDEVAERVAVAVLAQFEGLEPAEVSTEWGVRWPLDDGAEEVEIHGDDRRGAEIAARVNAGEVVQATVSTWRSPWTAVQS